MPIALVAALGLALMPADRPIAGTRGGLDVAGALLSLTGFTSVVYGFARAESLGWGSGGVTMWLAGGMVLLVAFVVVEVRAAHPLLPMRVLAHRARAGAFLAITLMFVAMFGFYLFMSYYTQTVLGYSPVRAAWH